ncbi:MAG: ATP-dependent DNA helicase [Candidatus Hydrothermarchaeales archaeon]
MAFFPYSESRHLQEELISAIYSSQEMLCSAHTGVGKSISALSGFLADKREGEKIVVLTRTKSQAKIFLQEMNSISQKANVPFLTIQLRSKQDLCSVFKQGESNYDEFLQLCRLHKACEHKKNFYKNKKRLGDLARNIAEGNFADGKYLDFWSLTKELSGYGCPYMVLQGLVKYSDVVIASYLYLLHPFIREAFLRKLGRPLEELLVILDEAHNLQGLDLLGKTLSFRTVDLAANELNYDFSNIYALFEGDDMELDILTVIEPNEIIFLYERGIEVLERRMRKGQRTSYAYRAASFLDLALKLRSEKNWVFFRQANKLHIKALFPSEIIRPLRKARKLLLMSGTLTPPEGYRTLYGMDDAEILVLPNVFPRENRSYYAVRGLNTGLKLRENLGDKLWVDYASVLKQVHEASPKTTLVFFPSYDVMKKVGKHLDSEVMSEPTDSREVEAFWRKVKNREKKMVLAVSGGKMSEGVEYTVGKGSARESVVATVVIAGFPFPVPDFEMEMKGRYYDREFGTGKAFFFLSVLPMVNKVLQGVGRAVRSERDKAAVVFLDDRMDYFIYFPEEVRHELQMCEIDKLQEEITWFHKH